MGMATQNAVVRETRFDRQPAGRPSFLFTLRKTDEDGRPAQIEIQIKNERQLTQTITHVPNYWRLEKGPFQVSQVDYFIKSAEINEGIEHYHDFIVGDFNFDGREDFAILYDLGGNAGPFYSYYFQNEAGMFNVDKTFPLNAGYFPAEIDDKNKTLTTMKPSGCCTIRTIVYKLADVSRWDILSDEEKDMD